MLKVAKEWMMAIDAGFAIITGYSIIEVLGFIFAFSLEELTNNILKLQHESELRRQEFEKIELESKKFEV